MRVVQQASEGPHLASTLNIAAFNLGNAMGAFIGGAMIDLEWGLPAVSIAGAAVTLLGLLLTLISAALGRRRSAAVACAMGA